MATDYSELIASQARFFQSGATLSYEFRLGQLKRLREMIQKNEAAIFAALHQDLRKSNFENYVGEVGMVLEDLRYGLKHLKKWMRPQRAHVPLSVWPGKARIYPDPYGQVLVIAPWNYPVQLALTPLYGAMAAGNCVVLKPSEISVHTSALLARLIRENFSSEYLAVVEGGVEATRALLAAKWDYIFFTGSTRVGRIVMEAASQHLTPLTLELGGKSPCIVDASAKIKVAARRIAWGKFFNAGQTCIAPDYLLVQEQVRDALVNELKVSLEEFYGTQAQKSPDYPRIINQAHFERLKGYLGEGKTIIGGQFDASDLYIAPTVLGEVSADSAVMQEEIFGPILPLRTFRDWEDALNQVRALPTPLAAYLFTESEASEAKMRSDLRFGGGCINDTMTHLAVPGLPFGGVGTSGFGAYHGKKSFETFSHSKSIFKKSSWVDPRLRYPPYGDRIKLARRLMG